MSEDDVLGEIDAVYWVQKLFRDAHNHKYRLDNFDSAIAELNAALTSLTARVVTLESEVTALQGHEKGTSRM